MGLMSSTPAAGPPGPLGADQIHTPEWAREKIDSNPTVYFDIAVDEYPLGRIEMHLAAHVAPKT